MDKSSMQCVMVPKSYINSKTKLQNRNSFNKSSSHRPTQNIAIDSNQIIDRVLEVKKFKFA